MKRLLLCTALLLILSACGGETNENNPELSAEAAEEITEPAAQPIRTTEPDSSIMPIITIDSTKRALADAIVIPIAAPAAGNFPTGFFNYANRRPGGDSRFTQTIEWSPPVARVFETDTEYTAILTLVPTSGRNTFDGVAISDITGLPEENVTGITAQTEDDSIVITISFEKTASENAEPQLLFNDDFDGDRLDTTKWALAPNWDRQDRSTWDESLVSVKDGYLHLGLVRDRDWGYQKTSDGRLAEFWVRGGAIRTMDRNHINILFDNNFGYYESRIKFPKVQGTWGAFWLMSQTLREDAHPMEGAEIDIIESIHNEQNIYNAAVHSGGYGTGLKSIVSHITPVEIYDGDFHVFGLEWSPTEYIFYVDGVEFWRVEGDINQNPNYMKLSVEGAGWAGTLPEGFEEDEMIVDYVRVYNQPKIWNSADE